MFFYEAFFEGTIANPFAGKGEAVVQMPLVDDCFEVEGRFVTGKKPGIADIFEAYLMTGMEVFDGDCEFQFFWHLV